eukprot:2325190-Alexandrium_andersonii.AAC.1
MSELAFPHRALESPTELEVLTNTLRRGRADSGFLDWRAERCQGSCHHTPGPECSQFSQRGRVLAISSGEDSKLLHRVPE